MEQITINLTLEELNKILESLGERPYVEVFQLINKIPAQAVAQLQAKKMREQEFSEKLNESEIRVEK